MSLAGHQEGSNKHLRKLTTIVKPSSKQVAAMEMMGTPSNQGGRLTAEKSPADKTRELLAKAAGLVENQVIG
jgi:hypothetical protein